MKQIKAHTPEYLSQDIMDKEFVRTFKVIHGLQFILGSCRIEARDQFVTSPTRLQKCYTILCILIVFLLNLGVIYLYLPYILDSPVYYLYLTTLWMGFVIFLCVIIHVRFCNGQGNADFFIQMQKLDRIMGLDKIKDMNLKLQKVNGCLLLLLSSFFVLFAVACCKKNFNYMTFIGTIFSELTSIVEIIYCSNLLIYFVVRLRFMNAIMRNHLTQKKQNCNKPKTLNLISNRNLRKLALRTHSFPTSDTHVYLKELLDLFSMFQKLYRFQLFVFCLKLILGSLCAFGFTLYSIQKNAADIIGTSSMFFFTVIDIFTALFLGFSLQIFFDEVKETKRLSIAVMAEYYSGQLREKARKMLKMAEETPPRLSIYDMYDMDAGIFLTLFSLITSLIVTLLQFALL